MFVGTVSTFVYFGIRSCMCLCDLYEYLLLHCKVRCPALLFYVQDRLFSSSVQHFVWTGIGKKKKVMVYECLVIMLLCDKFLTSKKETLNVLQF